MNPIETYRQRYDARLFPCKKRSELGDASAKMPYLKGWRTSSYTAEELLHFWSQGHPLAWALGPTDLVVDVDAPSKERPDKQGPESLKRLNNLLGVPLHEVAPEVKTGNGGSHFYLTVPDGVLLSKAVKELPGIDFKYSGGYVVIAGSPHWQGGNYKFSADTEFFDKFDRPLCPPVLLDLIRRKERVGLVTDTKISGELLERMLAPLNQANYRDHETWFPIFVAAHHATGGSMEGLAVFDEWCRHDPKYVKRNIKYRWTTLDPTQDGITIGTLFKELADGGHNEVYSMARASIEFDDEDFTSDEFFDANEFDPELFGIDFVEFAPPKRDRELKRKRIHYIHNEIKLNNKIIAQIAKMPNMFQRANLLVTISDSDIRVLNPLGLCEQISSVCDLGIEKEDRLSGETTWESKRIPERVGKQIASHGSWFGVRRLKMVTPIPIMAATGVIETPGYDTLSGVFYAKTIDVPRVATTPTLEAAKTACSALLDIVHDFPFAGDAHRSAWLASLLAVLSRPAIDGPTPLTFVDGNQRGVGKGLLTDMIYLICFGANMPKHASMPTDEAEMSKTLLSIAMRNSPTYNFDNLPSGAKIGSPSLDSVLTNGTVAGRVLGRSEVHDYPIETVFFASGNRVSLNKNTDIIRRLNYINLTSKLERAEDRKEFKHGGEASLRKHVLEHRATLIHAGLTILEYARQSSEVVKLRAWGSYEAFSTVVRRALVLIDMPDPLNTRIDLELRDDSRDELGVVIDAMKSIGAVSMPKGMTAGEIVEAFNGFDSAEPVAALAYRLLVPPGTNNPAMRLGRRLTHHYRDQVCNNQWIRYEKCKSRKINVFWVENVK